jgi:hypothetical protein
LVPHSSSKLVSVNPDDPKGQFPEAKTLPAVVVTRIDDDVEAIVEMRSGVFCFSSLLIRFVRLCTRPLGYRPPGSEEIFVNDGANESREKGRKTAAGM